MDRKKALSAQTVKKFLDKTGFPFEWKMERALREKEWQVRERTFLDLEEGKKREIDIVAMKTINSIDVFLVVECKHSEKDSWVFFSPNRKVDRFYGYFTCRPSPGIEALKKVASHSRILNSAEPIAINFKTYDNYSNKQSTDLSITDALYKVVKALIYCYAQFSGSSKRQIYFPLILFSGPIFLASYSDRLRVKRCDYVQFPFGFESEAYIERKKGSPTPPLNPWELDFDSWKEQLRTWEIEGIKNVYKELIDEHLIEFVTGRRLATYLDQLESEIGKIDINLWPVESKKE